MAKVVDGHIIAQSIYQRLHKTVPSLKRHGIAPKLGVILVGGDKPSQTYVRKKAEAASMLGVRVELIQLPARISTEELLREIANLQKPRHKLTGLIVQLPLPKHINTGKVLEAVSPAIDVDCLTQTNLGKLVTGSFWIEPPTPGAIISILKYYRIPLRGAKTVIIGAGALVGRPLANMLIHEQATISVLNRYTPNSARYTKDADIIITGVGKRGLLRGTMIKRGAVVIDAGVSFVGGKMYGDVDFSSVRRRARLVTPTPGGVGPLTVAKLIENTVRCADKILTQRRKRI